MPSSSLPAVSALRIDDLRVAAFRIPTESPESDGTLEWTATGLVVVELAAAGERGLGYTYGEAGIGRLIADELETLVIGRDPFDIGGIGRDIVARFRNAGRQGAVAQALSAVDVALWDLKARLLQVPLIALLGAARASLPVYGSGGFTSYADAELQRQFRGWSEAGIARFKMKVGREPERDRDRVRAARAAIGDRAALFVDANSAYTRNEALVQARMFVDEADVRWLEQPLPPGDLEGLRFLRGRVPAGLRIADGEYGYDLNYFRRLLEAQAVDVVMADATRCGGITGFLAVAVLCETWMLPLSSHCAPALHVHPGCAALPMIHAEYFHDHARIEQTFFDGAAEPAGGELRPDRSRPGHGLIFKWADAAPFAA